VNAGVSWPTDILRAARPTEESPLIDSKVETWMPEIDLVAEVRA
jgi:mycothiol S-conjugate amidase